MTRLEGKQENVLGYVSVDMALRAPRVAAVFDGGPGWEVRALDGLRQFCLTWGGAGFVLVPHHGGQVSDLLRDAVRLYDPDYVIALTHHDRIEHLAQAEAGDGGSAPAAPEITRTPPQARPSSGTVAAARGLREACAPLHVNVSQGQDFWPHFRLMDNGLPGRTALALPAVGEKVVSMPPAWRGPAALAAALDIGVIDDLEPAGAPVSDDEAARVVAAMWNPRLHASRLQSALDQIANAVDDAPETTPPVTAVDRTMEGLTWVSRVTTPAERFEVVAGAEADDFALAMILKRTTGGALWLHPDWSQETDSLRRINILDAYLDAPESTGQLYPDYRRVVISSISLDEVSLLQCAEFLRSARHPSLVVNGVPLENEPLPVHLGTAGSAVEAAIASGCRTHLADRFTFDRRIPMPVEVIEDGSRRLAAPLPLPATDLGEVGMRPYFVDIDAPGLNIPTSCGLDAGDLLLGHHLEWMRQREVLVRCARGKISYSVHNFGLVLGGSSLHRRLVTPQFGLPTLEQWVAARAKAAGLAVAPSSVGHKTRLLERLAGGRGSLTDIVDSPIRAALHQFATPPMGGRDSFLAGGGIRLDRTRAVLTFTTIASHWPEDRRDEARPLVDQLVGSGLLRRGILLKCLHCTHLDFYDIDSLGSGNQCTRCGEHVPLTADTWKKPGPDGEPVWFYDAHPLAAGLAREHSDVPLLAAAYLRSHAEQYADTGEIIFCEEAGSHIAEIDLISYVDGELIIGEGKSTATLGTGKTRTQDLHRRLRVCALLGADQLLFATTDPQWSDADMTLVHDEITKWQWGAHTPPRPRFISDLGSPEGPTDLCSITVPLSRAP
ncbi:hypothetical protein [Arsenicicoccus dermatophilus]|uniref:hypothetical protein n=1 Tax=Arsenicicoccus dermatophilus TaxID=1076331 RepID=UPI00391729D0